MVRILPSDNAAFPPDASHTEAARQEASFTLGPFALDDACAQAMLHGEPLRLSHMEYRLLSWFLRHPDVYVSAEEICHALWGREASGDPRTVQVHIHNLRRKIEADPSQPRYLQSAWGKGYLFCPVPDQDTKRAR